MGVALGFPTPFANLCAMSRKTTLQSTSLPPSSAPKMVLPIVIVTRVGLSGWTIGTRNSSSRQCRSTRQSHTEYPSLGSTWCINYWKCTNERRKCNKASTNTQAYKMQVNEERYTPHSQAFLYTSWEACPGTNNMG